SLYSPAAIWGWYIVRFVLLCNGRERQYVPCLMFPDVSNKIVGMQSLHDNDNCSSFLTVETAAQSVVVPLVYGAPTRFGHSVARFQWVIDNDDVGPTSR